MRFTLLAVNSITLPTGQAGALRYDECLILDHPQNYNRSAVCQVEYLM